LYVAASMDFGIVRRAMGKGVVRMAG
jgi:hypothetical protein